MFPPVLVEYGSQKSEFMELLIIAGSRPSLLRSDWLLEIKLDWNKLHHIEGFSA